jgi:capsular polysaccharide biosynthesis protein
LDSALKAVDDAQGEIDRAQLNVEQAQSEAGRQLRIIDAPRVPTAPQSNTIKRLVTMFLFTLLGVLISLAALITTTVLDRSIRSRTQLAKALQSTNVTASIPELRSLARASRHATSSKKAA